MLVHSVLPDRAQLTCRYRIRDGESEKKLVQDKENQNLVSMVHCARHFQGNCMIVDIAESSNEQEGLWQYALSVAYRNRNCGRQLEMRERIALRH